MSLIDDLKWRYATKKMSGATVPQEKVDYILEAARLAPSSSGLQPYKIIVISDKALLEKIKDTYKKVVVKETEAEYELVSDPTGATFTDFVKWRVAPYKVFYVDPNDPITFYFDRGDSQFLFKFKNITLDEFASEIGNTALVGDIPSYIIIIPSNNMNKNPYSGRSSFTEDGTANFKTREIAFTHALDKNLQSPGMSSPLQPRFTWKRGTLDMNGERSKNTIQALEYYFEAGAGLYANGSNFINQVKPTTRKYEGLRSIYRLIERLVTNYTITDGVINSFDYLSRLTADEFYDSLVSCNKLNFNNVLKRNGITRVRQVTRKDSEPTRLGTVTGSEVGQTFNQFGSV